MAKVSVIGGKGVNKDLLPSELPPGVWSDMMNFRSRNGSDSKFQGGRVKDATSPLALDGITEPTWIKSFPGPTRIWAIYGSSSKSYAFEGWTHYDITRYAKTDQIVAHRKFAANTAEVQVMLAHHLTTGDIVTVFGAAEAAYNVAQVAVTVITGDTFRYTTPLALSGASTTGAMYVVVQSNATTNWDTIIGEWPGVSGGILNGVFFLYMRASTTTNPEPRDNGLYYWDGTSTSTRLRRVPFFIPSGTTVVRPFNDYLIGLAGHNLWWTDSVEPGAIPTTTTASDTNDAGLDPLGSSSSPLVDCLEYGESNIVYASDARYAMKWIGGNQVFSFDRLPGKDGLYQPGCIANTPAGQVFMTLDADIKIHQGGEARSIANGRVKSWLQTQIRTYGTTKRIFLIANTETSEVWIAFWGETPVVSGLNRILAWNWNEDTWQIFNIVSNTIQAADVGVWPLSITSYERLVGIDYANNIILFDDYEGSASPTSGTLERTGIDFDDRDQMKYIDRTRLNIDGTAGDSWQVYHGASSTADGAVTYASPATYTVGTTDYACARGTQGRFGALKLTTSAANATAVRSIDLDVKGGGKR